MKGSLLFFCPETGRKEGTHHATGFMPAPRYSNHPAQQPPVSRCVRRLPERGAALFRIRPEAEILFPQKRDRPHGDHAAAHAPPEYADRNTLWNAAEAVENQWNSQLARRIVLAIPREIPLEQQADLLRDYCREFFVSKGMIADFAIHDKGDGNPHAHILLTMRAMDEKGK